MGVTHTLALLVERQGLAAKVKGLLEHDVRDLPYPFENLARLRLNSLPWVYKLKTPVVKDVLFDYLERLENPTSDPLPERGKLEFYDIAVKFSSERFVNPPRKVDLSLNFKSEFQGTYGDPDEMLILNIDTHSSSFHHAEPSPPEQLLVDTVVAALEPIYGFSSVWEELLSEKLHSATPWKRYRHTMLFGRELAHEMGVDKLRATPAYEVRELLGPMFFIVSPSGLLGNEWPVEFDGMTVWPLDHLLTNELYRHEREVTKHLDLEGR